MKHLRFLVEESKSDSHMFCSPLHNNASLHVGILLVNRCINILFISLHILSFIMMPRKTSFITVFSQFPAFLYFICKSLKPHYILSNIQWEQKQACSITNPLPSRLLSFRSAGRNNQSVSYRVRHFISTYRDCLL